MQAEFLKIVYQRLLILLLGSSAKLNLCVILLLLIPFAVLSQPVIDLQKELPSGYIGKYLQIFEDKKGELTLVDILQPEIQQKFKNAKSPTVHTLTTGSSKIWMKVNINNVPQVNEWYLALLYPDINDICFYGIIGDSVVKQVQTGNLYDYSTREFPHPFYAFSLLPECKSYYIRIQSSNPLHVALQLKNKQDLIQVFHTYDLWQGVFLGLTLIISLVFATFYFLERKTLNVYFLWHVLGTALLISAYQGHLKQYVFPDSSFIHLYQSSVIAFLTIPTLIFVCKFLNVKVLGSFYKNIFRALIVSLLIIIALDTTGFQKIARILLETSALFSTVFILGISVFVASKGDRPTKIFIFGWLLYILGIFSAVITSIGSVPYNLIVYNAYPIGVGFNLIFASIALSYRYREYKKHNDQLELQMIKHLQESEQFVKQQNKVLEEKVNQRTREIEQQRTEIEIKNKIINSQNQKLMNYNSSLEQQVEERTRKLTESYQEIKRKSRQLEQFTYVSAHNLRAPVTTLLGLANIFKLEETSSENLYVIEKVKETCLKLDNIIIDLNNILNISDPANIIHERFELEEVLNKATEVLCKEIQSSEAKIVSDFTQCKQISTIKPFLFSVIYNLISNAIKYRHSDRKPEIKISSGYLNEDEIYLSVEDNGIGIDLKSCGEKLFGLYKRFALHVKGRGMGLFMVKTQVELMEGKIEVSSIPGQGSSFKIYLPLQRKIQNTTKGLAELN